MNPRDFIRYLVEMAISKFQRLKRVFWIMSLGSLLVFAISISTSFLESWVTLKYQDRHVLVPYSTIGSNYVDAVPFELISQYNLKEVANAFKDTTILSSKNTLNVEVINTRTSKQGTLSFEVVNQGYLSVQESLMDYYNWHLNDTLRIGNSAFIIQKTHMSDSSDIKMPFYFLNHHTSQLNYDNILTIYSQHNIDEIISNLNQHLLDSNYYYEVEPFSIDDLLKSLIQLLRRVLMAISLCIFLVSSSNIGTIMPYFIMEYEDEIEVLRMHGMSKEVLINLFICFTMLILFSSLIFSGVSIVIVFKLISILSNVPFKLPLIRLTTLGLIQVVVATLLTLGSIKKAMDTITYI